MKKRIKTQSAGEGSRHDQEVEDKKQTLLTHLMALRNLLIHCFAAVLIGFVASFYLLCSPIMAFIEAPIQQRGIEIIYTAVNEALTTQLKVSLLAGVVVVSPYIVFELWRFIKPALYDHEIRLFRGLFLVGLLLFLTGIVFCYKYVYDLAINFFLVSGEGVATPMLSIDKYVNFQVSFMLPFGVVFELPVAIFMATRKGMVTYEQLAKNRKYVFFGIFVLAAILTPPDVISQLMLGLPMYVLYEISVQVARFTKPSHKEEGEAA